MGHNNVLAETTYRLSLLSPEQLTAVASVINVMVEESSDPAMGSEAFDLSTLDDITEEVMNGGGTPAEKVFNEVEAWLEAQQ